MGRCACLSDLDNGVSNLSHGHAAREACRGVAICHIGNQLQPKLARIHHPLQHISHSADTCAYTLLSLQHMSKPSAPARVHVFTGDQYYGTMKAGRSEGDCAQLESSFSMTLYHFFRLAIIQIAWNKCATVTSSHAHVRHMISNLQVGST